MRNHITLPSYLSGWSHSDPNKTAVADTIRAIAAASAKIAARIARGSLEEALGTAVGDNIGGDKQTKLDVWANDQLIEAFRNSPAGIVFSEEEEGAITLNAEAPIAVAMDPLDGSSNIDTNVSIGTIFSLLPNQGESSFTLTGAHQLAAGYVVYGPQCAMVLTVGEGAHIFTLDPQTKEFCLTVQNVQIKKESNEYAINASNYRFWSDSIHSYIDDCLAGVDGPRGENVNMRWIASLVAECHRILVRGGVFLYPRDTRKGYEKGRLRLVYEANPIAFLVEQAGGKAIDGFTRILDIVPEAVHQRTPLMFGSASEIDRIARYKIDPNTIFERSPLFGRRGLLRV